MFDKPTPWNPGDKFSAAHLNQPIPILNSVASILAADGSGLSVAQTQQGTVISRDPGAGPNESFIGLITSEGPNAAVDYTDARYWVKRQYVKLATAGTEPATFGDDAPPQDGQGGYHDPFPVTAVNLAEVTDIATGAGTHVFATNGTVLVRVHAVADRSNPPNIRHVFSHSIGTQVVIVKVSSNAAGGGQYSGRIQTGSSNADGTGTLTMPEGMTNPAADDAMIINLVENGLSTHELAVGSYHIGLVVGTVVGGTHDGKTIVAVSAFGIGCG